MKKFYTNNFDDFRTLKQYIPIVSKVHGSLHPEFKVVETIFNKMLENINLNLDIKENFDNLKKITNNYLIPSDVCESYEKVYDLLKKLNENYTNN